MRILVTGSGGRVGRAIYIRLMRDFDVIGLDRSPCSTATYVGDIRDQALLNRVLKGVDAVVHVAALHAPHVSQCAPSEFTAMNVEATACLATLAVHHGVQHFVFTSTTALYGAEGTGPCASWVDESYPPSPRTRYHHSKIAAEAVLQDIANTNSLPVTVLQMSRCFPERADKMAIYRLTRGIDYRDVAHAHACAIARRLPGFTRFIVSGATPFSPSDCSNLWQDAAAVITNTLPDLAQSFAQRGWLLPQSLDRVYCSTAAQHALGWTPKYGWQSVLDMLDEEWAEVLPVPRAT